MYESGNQNVATKAALGYEIHVQGQKVLLVNRRLWALGYAVIVLAAILGFVIACVVSALEKVEPKTGALAPIAFLLFGGPVAIPMLILAVSWFRRRRSPLEQIASLLIIDREARVLRDGRGLGLADLEDVRVKEGLDLMTRGLSRRVLLRWPGGRRVVFRTLSPARAQEAAEILVEMCGGSSPFS